MPKRKYGFNTVYISERLQESLRPISHCALSTIIAPMGYGKTTAADWYLEKKEEEDGATVIRISVYSDNLAVFWRSVQEAFFHAGIDLLRDYPCPVDAVGGSMLIDDLCHVLGSERECCIFIDDFHLLTDSRAAHFICRLAQRLPQASASDCLRAFLRRFPALRRQAFSRPTSGTTTPTGRCVRAMTGSTPLCPLSSICKNESACEILSISQAGIFEAQCSSQSRLLPTALCQPRRSFSFFSASICGSNVTSQCQRL